MNPHITRSASIQITLRIGFLQIQNLKLLPLTAYNCLRQFPKTLSKCSSQKMLFYLQFNFMRKKKKTQLQTKLRILSLKKLKLCFQIQSFGKDPLLKKGKDFKLKICASICTLKRQIILRRERWPICSVKMRWRW